MTTKGPKLSVFAILLVAVSLISLGQLAPAGQPAIAVGQSDGTLAIGVGIVIGLSNTGDRLVDQRIVDKSIVGVLRRTGLDPWQGEIAPGRIAKVIMIAELLPDAREGSTLTITLTAVGGATSLAGGTLLPAPLHDPNGELRAIAQGAVATSTDRPQLPGNRRFEAASAYGFVAHDGTSNATRPSW